jgi:hypothetical protein
MPLPALPGEATKVRGLARAAWTRPIQSGFLISFRFTHSCALYIKTLVTDAGSGSRYGLLQLITCGIVQKSRLSGHGVVMPWPTFHR